MSNEFYNATGWPATHQSGASSPARAELLAIALGFDKMPALAGQGGKAVFINAGGSAMSAVSALTWNGSNLVTADQLTVTNAFIANGNVTLGNAVSDTVSVGGVAHKNATGNWTFPTPSSGVTMRVNGNGVALLVDRLGTGTIPPNTSGTGALFIGNTSAASPSYISVSSGNASLSGVNFGDTDADSRGFVRYDHTNERLQLGHTGVAGAFLDAVGFGIGEVAANGFRLDVEGAATNGPIARFYGSTVQTRGLELSSFVVGGVNGVGFLWNAPGSPANGIHAWASAGTEIMRADQNFQLLIGDDAGFTSSGFSAVPRLQVSANGAGDVGKAGIGLAAWHSASPSGSRVLGMKSRGVDAGTRGIVSANDSALLIQGSADDGVAFIPLAQIQMLVDGTPGVNDMPGRIVFSVTRDGAASLSEAMRISNTGRVDISPPLSGTTALLVDAAGGAAPAIESNQALAGDLLSWQITNTSNTANSGAGLFISSGGSSAGDPFVYLGVSGLAEMIVGLDNSDNDALVVSNSSSLGTNNRVRIPLSGDQITMLAGLCTPVSSQAFVNNPAFDCSLSNYFEFSGAMTANVITSGLTNANYPGQTVRIRVKQDATGGRTFADPLGAKVVGSVGLTANAASILTLTRTSLDGRWEGFWTNLPV